MQPNHCIECWIRAYRLRAARSVLWNSFEECYAKRETDGCCTKYTIMVRNMEYSICGILFATTAMGGPWCNNMQTWKATHICCWTHCQFRKKVALNIVIIIFVVDLIITCSDHYHRDPRHLVSDQWRAGLAKVGNKQQERLLWPETCFCKLRPACSPLGQIQGSSTWCLA